MALARPPTGSQGPPATQAIELAASQPEDVAVVRRTFQRQLDRWECADVADAVLVFSELVTNAVVHAGGASRIVAARLGSVVRLEVHDGGATRAARRTGHDTLGGRGLSIVELLATRCGSRLTAAGKVVWAELPCVGNTRTRESRSSASGSEPIERKEAHMSGETDQAKGRIKEAVGDLTDNDRLKNEGKADKVGGKIKDAVDTVKDKLTGKDD